MHLRHLPGLALILAFAFAACCLAIVLDGLRDDLHPADLAVVLGNTVHRDGTPSVQLQARLDHAADLYRQGYFKYIFVSGAHGKEGYDEPCVMARYLEAHGIPANIIYQDNEGFNTWPTAQNTATFLKQHQLKSVLVISQYFHLPRCRLAFSRWGIAPTYTSHAHLWVWRDFYSVPREVIGYLWYDWKSAWQTPGV